jgi:hypothetical protein
LKVSSSFRFAKVDDDEPRQHAVVSRAPDRGVLIQWDSWRRWAYVLNKV